MSGQFTEHLSARRMQEFFERGLPKRDALEVEEHLAVCARCSAEFETWRLLFEELDALPALGPHAGFADRVMRGVELPEPLPLAARVRARLTGLASGRPGAHASAERLQELLEGMLPARADARLQAHLRSCEACGAEADAWHAVFGALDGLDRFEPSEGFAARVMDGFAIRAPAPARVPAPAPVWSPLVAAARRLVPRTRRAWAALSGIAVTPAVTVALVFYAVFSHPTLTPSALASYLWWQITDVGAWAWNGMSSFALESAPLFDAYALVESVASKPLLAAGGLLIYAAACAFALRVLYRQLFGHRPMDGRYAQLSLS
jgi:anti-sigma factor RsiW